MLWMLSTSVGRAQDRDADGVLDERDLCPEIPEGPAQLFPGDGCPDADTDGDRIVDDYDVCPDIAETVNGFEDADGCPDTEGAEIHELGARVLFVRGASDLGYDALAAIQRLASILREHPELSHVEVVGRADEAGDGQANHDVSRRRARAVCDALVQQGVASERLTPMGVGALPNDDGRVQLGNRGMEVHAWREQADLQSFEAFYEGGTRMDVEIGARPRASGMRPLPRGSRPSVRAYASRVIGERAALYFALQGTEEVLVFHRVPGDRAVGIVEVHDRRRRIPIPWTARWRRPLDQREVVRMITSHRAEILRCFEAELQHEPTLTGRVTITMTIATSGESEHVHVAGDTLNIPTPSLGECVVRVVDDFRFDPAPLGGSISYTFPFVFEPNRIEFRPTP
ncbi:MAG: AgmX/PglI C-terminal domain-containing protein [Sandaracinus sp.]